MVSVQMALEDGVKDAAGSEKTGLLLCERGSLDPLAYWLYNGWPEHEFFTFTETGSGEHYRRYAAVIHLVTVADGASDFYRFRPRAPRRETPEQAVRIDGLLERVWGDHPGYVRVDNREKGWEEKAGEVRRILCQVCGMAE